MPKKDFKLSIVVPVYNEEKNVPVLIERMSEVMKSIGCDYEIVFALDPCSDRTEEVINAEREKNDKIKLIVFSRRFGQPAATLAGIHYCQGDACVVIDADLQDPPELIIEMVKKWQEDGYDVVYAQRTKREGENIIKKSVAYLAYFLINRISEVPIPRNTGDFRLMSRRVIEELKKLKEVHAFLRGLVGVVGFSQIAIPYERDARLTGKGNYNSFTGSFKIGLNGIIAFSSYPLQFIAVAGFVLSFFSFLLGTIFLIMNLFGYDLPLNNPVQAILISFFSGVHLLSIGIMGQYVSRIYDQVKYRPLFIVREAHGFSGEMLK